MKYPNKQKAVEITRTIDLPVHTVWQAWTEPETLKKWWGPENYSCPSSTMDLREGGKYLFCMRSEDGDDFWSTGNYKEIILQKKLVFTDHFSDGNGKVIPASALNMPGNWPDQLLITIYLENKDGKTTMSFLHEGVPAELHDDCLNAWHQSFDKLEKNLKGS